MDRVQIDLDRKTQPVNLRFSSEWDSGFVAAAFIVRVRGKLKLFEDENAVREFERTLLAEVSSSSCEALLYLFMPDHCQILLRRKSEVERLFAPMKRFKRRAGYWLTKIDCTGEWCQKPGEKDNAVPRQLIDRVLFMLNEPVRCGLVDDWRQYRYRGSSLVDFESWLERNSSTSDSERTSVQSTVRRSSAPEKQTSSGSSIALP